MTKRIATVVVALLALLTSVLTVSNDASALSTPCTSSYQIARRPANLGGGYHQGSMTCQSRNNLLHSGDVNMGHRQLTGQVCLVTMRNGWPLYTLSCGYNFFTPSTFVNDFTWIATVVYVGNGSNVVSGQILT